RRHRWRDGARAPADPRHRWGIGPRLAQSVAAGPDCVTPDAALAVGHDVRVVPATLVRSLGVGARRLKTDQRDAGILSEVSCRIDLPSVHVPSRESRERKTMCGMREVLVGARTKLACTAAGHPVDYGSQSDWWDSSGEDRGQPATVP